MNADRDMRAQALSSAERALSAGLVGISSDVLQRGRLLQPVPVLSAADRIDGWVVGFAVDDNLVGLIQFTADMSFHRFASFQRRPDALDGCPAVAVWFDEDAILARAMDAATQGATLTRPVLSYDRSPDRLAWRVEASAPTGETTRIFVAGDYAYRATP